MRGILYLIADIVSSGMHMDNSLAVCSISQTSVTTGAAISSYTHLQNDVTRGIICRDAAMGKQEPFP